MQLGLCYIILAGNIRDHSVCVYGFNTSRKYYVYEWYNGKKVTLTSEEV